MPLAEVADRTGFHSVEYLSAVPHTHFRSEHRPKK